MKGNIWYSSEEGKGTTFYFTVRLKKSGGKLTPNEEERPISNVLAALPPLRVLLAEDNVINRMFLSLMLKDAGHHTIEVENGRDAVNKVREAFESGEPLDLILMDIQMPEMNGMEAAQRIRRLAGPAAMTPIIAITAFAMEEDKERFLRAGMQAYVTKPVDFDELVESIMEVTESDYLD